MPKLYARRGPLLATLVLLAAIAGAAGVAGLAAAHDHTDVSPADPEPGVATNHTWVTHVDDGVDNTTDVVTLYYGNTDADLSRVGSADASVDIDGSSVAVDFVSTDSDGQVLHLHLGQGGDVTGGESVVVSLDNDTVDNPPSAGTYYTEIVLGNTSGAFYGDSASLAIYETGSIDGTITDENGNAIENATVEFYTDEYDWYRAAETDASGQYSLSGVPAADEFHVWANKDSYTENTTRIGVQADATTSLDLSLVNAGTIQGQVLSSESDDGVSGVDVTAVENGTDTRVATATTDAAGNYSFDLAPGSYDVVATSLTYSNNQATNVSIDVDETAVADVYVAPHDTGTIAGTVTDADGNSLEYASVEVFSLDGHHVTTVPVDENDAYSQELPTGNYDLLAHTGSETYGDEWRRNVSVLENGTTTNDYALQEQAVVSGQVTDQNGDPVPNADVGVLDDGAWVDGARTDDTGHYSVGVPAGTYQLFVRASGFEEHHTGDVTLSTSSSTTMNIDVVEQATGSVAGTVTDADGNQIQDADVHAFRHHEWVDGTTTGASGDYSLGLPTGTYTIEVVTDAHGRQRFEDVEITENDETPLDAELIEPAVVSGEVDNGSAVNASNGVLIADGPVREFAPVQDGSYEIRLPPGEYSLTVFTENREISTSSASIDVESNDTVTEHFEVIQPSISNEQITQVDTATSPDMANVSVDAMLGPGVMLVRAFDQRNPPNADAPAELEHLGVTEETEFEIEFTVEGYDPETLLWGARDVDWSVEDNAAGAGHNVTISTKPVHLSAIDPSQNPMGPIQGTDYREIDWPTGENDTADVGFNQTVFFGLFDGSTLPDSALGELQGMTITTNAQTFSRPRFVDDSLEVYVAGPSTTVAGNQHEGFYDAFIPQSQLDAWGVDDPATDLEALYKGENSDFAVTEESDGAWIHLDITYSDGVVEVSPAEEEEDDGDDGGGGGLFIPPSDGDDSDDSDGDDGTDETDDTVDDTDEEDTDSETDSEEQDRREDQNDDAEDEPESDETPGFGLGIAIAALLGALALRLRDR